jgi:serine/threonine protein kinase
VYTSAVDAGRRIGKYVLGERIAVGGMAEVWAAHAEGLQGFVKPVALKFILESFSGDPELEQLFVNEARIAARLQHANLVAVFDFDKVDADQERGLAGRYYIAMERVEGHDLRRITEAARSAGYVFPVGVALYVAGEICKALRYVHEKRDAGGGMGLVHRDVSPHNVLVSYTGEVKLSDFGIAKAREHSARNTKPGSLRGKISYASPEQLGGQPVDHRTDQFAAGVTIWEILAGRRLFDGGSDLEILGKVARCEVPPLTGPQGRRDVPAPVEAVLRRMLAASPTDRFPTTADALSAVLALSSYSPDGAPLGELTRRLFQPGTELSRTIPLQASPVQADTRTMNDSPVASGAAGSSRTPTRRAKRTSEALARSPVAAGPGGDSNSVTEDVRTGLRIARFLGGVLVLAVIGLVGWMAVNRGSAERAASSGVAVPPASAALPAPPSIAPPPPPVAVAPEPMPASAPATLSAPAPAPTSEGEPFAARHAGTRRRRAREPAGDLVPVPPVPAKPVTPAVKQSANGAPIIE